MLISAATLDFARAAGTAAPPLTLYLEREYKVEREKSTYKVECHHAEGGHVVLNSRTRKYHGTETPTRRERRATGHDIHISTFALGLCTLLHMDKQHAPRNLVCGAVLVFQLDVPSHDEPVPESACRCRSRRGSAATPC